MSRNLEELTRNTDKPTAIVPGLGALFYKDAPLDVSYDYFKNNDADLMNMLETIYSRSHIGKICRNTERNLCNNDIFTREGALYYPKEDLFVILRKSWIITKGSMALAIHANRDGEEFFVSKDIVQYFTKNSPRHFIVKNPGQIKLNKNSDDFLEWAFEDRQEMLASSYDRGIKQINIIFPKYIKNPQNKQLPYAGQLYSGELYCGSFNIGMACAALHHPHPTFGLKRVTAQTQQL